jgi:hypothetical protein
MTEKDGVKIECLLKKGEPELDPKIRLGTVAIDLKYDRNALSQIIGKFLKKGDAETLGTGLSGLIV